MAATLGELETRVERIELQIPSLNTRNDIIALTNQQNTQHASTIGRIQELETRVDQLISAFTDLQRQGLDHETRITALE